MMDSRSTGNLLALSRGSSFCQPLSGLKLITPTHPRGEIMNHYPFTIRDYYDDAGHLAPIEHYIYRTMMDWYYLDEKPIPDNQRLMLRRLKLKPENEQELANVIADFFTLRDGHWHNKRIDAELEVYHSGTKQKSAAGRASALARAKANNSATVEHPLNTCSTPAVKKEEVRSKNKELKKGADAPGGNSSSSPPVPYRKIIDLYHEILPMLPRVVKLTDKRKSHIRARWNDGADNLKFWRDYFESVSLSKFMTGKSQPTQGRPVFRADIDFLIREDIMVKTQEGKYHHG
jgi:uncharacterized protein YdaU (DUF1376 family)